MLKNRELFADEIFGLHVQQSVEKLIKTWLVALGQKYPYIHDLNALFQLLSDADCDVSDYWELSDFNTFGVQLRYEGLPEDGEPINREAAIATIQSLRSQVQSALNLAVESENEEE